MPITYHDTVEQGSDAWLQLRCGKLTASEMKLIVTPTLKIADNDKTRAHLYELAAQRVTEFVEPHYVTDDMMRGREDELDAKLKYNEKIAPLTDTGFITNDKWGFTLGYSPDGLVGTDGLIEVKGRRQKFQMQTIVENKLPEDYFLQVQTGLLVSERAWLDFISYCGGMGMFVLRVYPDEKVQAAIVAAATAFEEKMITVLDAYAKNSIGLIPTERRIEEEITL